MSQAVDKERDRRGPTPIVASDLDQTLVGDNDALALFRSRLAALRGSITLVYVTGRSWELCPGLLTGEHPLPVPDYWITAIGTGIYRDSMADAEWERELDDGWDVDRCAALAAACPKVRPHPEPRLLTPHRLIYHVDPADRDEVVRSLGARIAAAGVAAQLIYSHGIELDIVPRAGNKGNALSWLMKKLGVPRERSVACGDSGNDIDLLAAAGKSVVVANAQQELLAWHKANPSPSRYLAKSSRGAGVVEGLEHFGLFADA